MALHKQSMLPIIGKPGGQSGPEAGQSDVRRELRFDLSFDWGQVHPSLRNLGVYRNKQSVLSRYLCGRIAPVVHHRRPQTLQFVLEATAVTSAPVLL